MILSGKSRLAGVMGWPVAHSLSPRARKLASDLDAPVVLVPWAERVGALDGIGLLVNTTSLGMTGQSALDLDLTALPAPALVTDSVYNPLETPLLAAARARGNPVVDGLGMLLHQARPGFEAWFGVAPTVTAEPRTFVRAELRVPACRESLRPAPTSAACLRTVIYAALGGP